ncbi:MAG: response regulator [Chloroflexi bacterium]|jgi:MinD-like ATPase involved in chromosome partitioning or flagellar assembly/CheY-like chemotaxis protein|nr:response regulator [Chloroflexota bacterium]
MSAKKILIVDADVASRNFIARNLIDQKYEVIQAGSGREGLIYAWRDRPDLAIIDPRIDDIKGEVIASKLKQDPRTANMPLIALSSDSSVIHIKSCMDAGFSEYITKSGQALTMLNETINRLFGISSAVIKQGGLLMVFLSAKGGTGTSSMCANIAMMVAQNQPEARVVVLDLVLPIGSIAPIVGYEGNQNIVTVTDMPPGETTPEFFRNELPEIKTWRFHLLSGSPDPESSNHLQVGRIWDIVKALKESYDYVFVDLGRSLSKISLPLIQHADLITLIMSTDISTVTLTKTLWQYLRSKGVEESTVYAILNRAVGLEGMSKAEAEKVVEIPVRVTMPYLSSNMAFANTYHQPFTLKFPKDTAAIVFQECAREMSTLARKLRAG